MQKFFLPFLALAIAAAFDAEADDSEENVDANVYGLARSECPNRAACSLSDVSLNTDEIGKQIYVITASGKAGEKISCSPSLKRSDYVVTRGLGAHKLQRRRMSWNEARKTCLMEGANLAVLDSAEKGALFRDWIVKESLGSLWVGFHDLYEEGSWSTVTGEMVDAMSYSPWAMGEPDNWNRQEHCGILWAPHNNDFGLDDYTCNHKAAFVCEINLCDSLGPLRLSIGEPGSSIDVSLLSSSK
ncbi:perlucin-like protein [Augochlora pura]